MELLPRLSFAVAILGSVASFQAAQASSSILLETRSFASASGLTAIAQPLLDAAVPRLHGYFAGGATVQSAAVTISGPATLLVGTSAKYIFKATISGITNQSVLWSVNGVSGGSAEYGVISTTGVYTPPAVVPEANSIVITAESIAARSASATFKSTLQYPTPVITGMNAVTVDGGYTFVVNVYGSDYVKGAEVLVGGAPVAASVMGAGDLEITLSNPEAKLTQVVVAVRNPSPGLTLSKASTINLVPTLVSAAAASRLLDQMTFGPTPSAVAHVQRIGLPAALSEQFQQQPTLYSQPPVGYAECPVMNVHCTQSDFLKAAVFGSDQLRQRVAMVLGEIFVAPLHDNNALPFYLNTLANDAFTNYRTIMQDVTLSPQMGMYLNMANSAKAPAGQIPNENYARELMQLFSIGLDVINAGGVAEANAQGNPLPTYTESQVQAFARALTGWTWALANGSAPRYLNSGGWNWNHAMVAVENQHDETEKTLLGGTVLPAGQTAEQDIAGALDNIFAQPNVGPFVSRQLIQHLVTGNPSPGYVERVAAVFANNGSGVRGDMKAVLTAILLDEEARAGDAQTGDQADTTPAVDGGHLREPLLAVANLLRGLQATQVNPSDPYPFANFMSYGLNSSGEAAFSQPSVFNYFSPFYTIPHTFINAPEFGLENTGTVLPRLNLVDAIVHNNIVYAQPTGFLVNLGATSTLGQAAGNPEQLVDTLGTIFMHSQMPGDMRSVLINAVSAVPATDPQSRAEIATYLVVTSSQYKIMH